MRMHETNIQYMRTTYILYIDIDDEQTSERASEVFIYGPVMGMGMGVDGSANMYDVSI